MEDNVYKPTKKMKVLALIALPISFVSMIWFLASIAMYDGKNAMVYASMIVFILSLGFEAFVMAYWIKVWYARYKEKYRGL